MDVMNLMTPSMPWRWHGEKEASENVGYCGLTGTP
jgi:hypothetical protein